MAPRMIAARKANEITVTIVKVVVARIAAPYTISSIEIGNNDPFGRSCQLNTVRYGVMPRSLPHIGLGCTTSEKEFLAIRRAERLTKS